MLNAWMFRVAHRLRRSGSLDLLGEIEEAPRLDREAALRLQLAKLQRLLAHAERNVPYYREMFRGLGIASRDVRSLEDFSQLPVLTKDVVRERQGDLLQEGLDPSRLLAHHSGGSTGVPLTFYRDLSYVDASMAGTYRNLRQAGWRPGEMVGFFWGWNDSLYSMPTWKFELRQWLRRMYQFDPFRSGPSEMNAWVQVWRRIRPRVALGYASTIARFAEHLENTGQELPPLSGVFTTAEKLYPQQRHVIARVFGCPVFDCYGSSEVQNIASECAQGSMHVNVDYVVLETGEAHAPDAPTPLLVTSLWNYTMPFIRYRNEDCGGLVDGDCPCGSGFPLMDLSVARTSDNFVLPGGRVVHGEFFTHLMYGSEGISSFQFHQTSDGSIQLYVVPGPGSAEGREHAIRSAVAQVEALAPGELVVEAREVESIALSSAGKHRFTRSDVHSSSQRA